MFYSMYQGYDHNKVGELEKARSLGSAAFVCGIVVLVINIIAYCFYFLIAMIVGIRSATAY